MKLSLLQFDTLMEYINARLDLYDARREENDGEGTQLALEHYLSVKDELRELLVETPAERAVRPMFGDK